MDVMGELGAERKLRRINEVFVDGWGEKTPE